MSGEKLTDLLSSLIAESKNTEEYITVGQITDDFEERDFGFFLLLFSLPAAVPLPGLGINAIIALPLLLITFQQLIGRESVWLPEFIRRKKISRKSLEATINKTLPYIGFVEKFIHPSMAKITEGIFRQVIGFAGFLMSISILVPLPLTNTVPAFGIAVMSVGVLTRDGRMVILGACIGIIWISLLIIGGIFGMQIIAELYNS